MEEIMGIEKENYGVTKEGKQVTKYTLTNGQGASVSFLDYGAVIQSIIVPDKDGKSFKLSSLRGKYVLVDFWASWCGPCMREMPNVVKLYKECKGKNFEIVGVSLDQKRDAWLNAVEKNKMKWIQVSDLKSWATLPVKLCNVSAVPYTVLIDPQGKVIALNLRGEELINKVKEVLNKK